MGRRKTGAKGRDAGPSLPATSPPLAEPLELLSCPVWQVDAKGGVVGGNRAARELEAAAGEALPLRTPGARELLCDEGELRRALAEGRPLEVCVRRPGDARRFRLVFEPLRDARGEPGGALLVLPEGTRAVRARSLLVRLLGTASRELQSPLAPLLSFARLGRHAAAAGDARRAQLYLERLERHALRLEEAVGELREFVETLTGEMRLSPSAFDLSAAVRESVDAAAALAREHGFVIHAPSEAVVVADRERIARVLRTLLSNAVRFSPGGGQVEVAVQLTRLAASVAVSDPGAGLPEARLLESLDGPCWDQEAPPGGLGLGLYVSREILERHGGSLRTNPTERGGTCLVLTLPRVCRV